MLKLIGFCDYNLITYSFGAQNLLVIRFKQSKNKSSSDNLKAKILELLFLKGMPLSYSHSGPFIMSLEARFSHQLQGCRSFLQKTGCVISFSSLSRQ